MLSLMSCHAFVNNQEEMRALQSLGASQFLAVADGVMQHFICPITEGGCCFNEAGAEY